MESLDPIKTTEPIVSENTLKSNPQSSIKNNKRFLLIFGSFSMIVFLLIIGFSIKNFLSSEIKIVSDDNSPTPTEGVQTNEDDIPTPSVSAKYDNKYIKLSNLKLQSPVIVNTEKVFKVDSESLSQFDGSGGNIVSGKVYSIGSADNWDIYFIELVDMGPNFAYPSIFYVSNKTDKYLTFQGNTSEIEWLIVGVTNNLLPDVQITNNIDGLPSFPSKLSVNNGDFDLPTNTVYLENFAPNRNAVKYYEYNKMDLYGLYSNLNGITTIDEYELMEDGKLENSPIMTNYFSRSVVLIEPTIELAKFYASNFNFMTDDQRVVAKWNDGRSEEFLYSPNSSGCGGYGSGMNVIKSSDISDSDLTIVGKTSFGDNLYQIKNPDSNILGYFYYTNYFPFRDPKNGPYSPLEGGLETKVLSYDDFVKSPNHFLYKDSLGDYIVFTNQEYAELAECGKPVVYLYPEKETQVSVKVDAKIRISDPDYGEGWDVIASPNGDILWNGQQFDYLYWDGLGNGRYPDVSDVGVVVNTNEAEKTIREHLALMNLNQKEIDDFVEFWIPLMPKTPYVKITWLGTNDMNALARMDINPRPNTLIRVFMDYEGLYQKIELKPQQFVSVERKGFTVVEWGGLLRR